ncbi:helix-turn-helix domain-containing protein [Kribbella sp. CA-293567]|uniref:helix-turn-helix domain-containing protein n=1 Tax=Kribbella sp. CA-293567 TaxID=3002436 RepID=UPI0022DD50D8|nr:helix-turn-helix domain-containing protein [Kribbella sp. CA-293567]WBQ05848.1 NB-ARC domain-containing protein [Kribbella sp. CA-293567]
MTNDDHRSDVASLLRRFRLRSKFTQEALAEAAGLSAQAISALENARRRHPRPVTIDLLTEALGLSAAERKEFSDAASRRMGDAGPRHLPPPIKDFTGRVQELDDLVRVLRASDDSPAVIISAVGGMGGVGKSALAIKAGHLVADDYPDGQLYLNLGGGDRSPLSTPDALSAVLRSLGVPLGDDPDNIDQAVGRYRTALAYRRVLLLLDDAASLDQVLPLLPGTRGSAVVITSRKQLTALPGVHYLALEVLTEDEALSLLGEVAGKERVAAEPEAARELVRRCGLLPLAIRIAGAHPSGRSVGGMAVLVDLLSDGDSRLDALSDGLGGGVRATIALSLRALARTDRPLDLRCAEAFPLLALFEGNHFPLRAAAKVLDLPLDQTEDVLERLVDVHLLETPALRQYRMHDLVRDFGREQVAETAQVEAWRRELMCYLGMLWRLDDIAGFDDMYGSREESAWSTGAEDVLEREQVLAWLSDELPNLVRLIRSAAGGDAADQLTAVRMALGMPRLAGGLMRFGEAYEALAAVVRLPLELDPRLEVGRIYQMGGRAGSLGLYEDGVQWRQEALPLARKLGNPTQLAICLVDLGHDLGRIGRPAEGMPHAEEGLALVEKHDIRRFEVGANVAVGAVAGWLGDLDRQRAAFDRALALMPTHSSLGQAVTHRSLIGRALQETGQYEASLAVLTAALAGAREGKYEVSESDQLRELGCTWLELGDYEKAREVLEAGLEIARRFPSDNREPALRHYLGRALAGLGSLPEARKEWGFALTQYRQVADPRAEEVVALLAGLGVEA